MSERTTVDRVVMNALAVLDHDELRKAVLNYSPCEEERRRVARALVQEIGVTEEQAELVAGMSDEVIAALKQRLNMVN